MTKSIPILLSLAAISLATIAAKGAYTNPPTVPVQVAPCSYAYSFRTDYHALPSEIDIGARYKEMTTPGPVLTFTINTPDGSDYPDTFRIQVWWVDPTPDTPVTNDENYTTDDDDTRAISENLDLTEFQMIPWLIVNSVGSDDGKYSADLPGTIFWRNHRLEDDDETPFATHMGIFSISDDSNYLEYNYATWASAPLYLNTDYTKGTVTFFNTNPANALSSSYYEEAILFNIRNNTNNITSGTVATFGKVFDDDMETLECIGDASTEYPDAVIPRKMSSTFTYMPLWNTYTDDEFDNWDQPETCDYIYIKTITMSDPSGAYPTNGLKFIEDLPYQGDDDEDDDGQGDMVYPNDSFAQAFNYTLSSDGVISYSLKDELSYTSDLIGSYIFYYRVYVDNGINDGTDAPYFRGYIAINIQYPFRIYLSDASYDSAVSYENSDGDTEKWLWFESETYGWYMLYDFPANRWVWSYEHGWVYMCGDKIDDDVGVFWYDAPSSYAGLDVTDDEVGWVWTRADAYPYFWSYKEDSWVWYYKDTDEDSTDNDDADEDYVERILDKRLFWSYRQEKFITPSEFGYGLSDWWTR